MHVENLSEILRKHPFIAGLDEEHIQLIISCASNVSFKEGEYLFRTSEDADKFFLIRTGRVAIEVNAREKGVVRIQTVDEGEVLGWSWLFPPYQWHFDACAVEDVRAVAMDGKCLRTKCEKDHELGYDVLTHFSQIMVRRLEATQLQLLDMY